MKPNQLREAFKKKETAITGWVAIGHPYSAEMMGHAGYDAVTIDLQHGPHYLDAALATLTAVSATPAMPMARVSGNNFFEINKLLDAGAYALICPMIDSVGDAERFVSACHYPPQGTRSYGPTRGFLYGGDDYFEHANDTIVTYGMIETPAGLAAVDEIAAVPGLDGLFIGPADLSLALGVSPKPAWQKDPLKSAILRIRDAAHNAGKMAGVFCISIEMAVEMKALGFDFLNYGVDSMLLKAGAQAGVDAIRKA